MADFSAPQDPGPNFHYSAMVEREKGHFRTLLWTHRAPTIVYCLVFWSFGMCVGFLGPTLWDLGCQTGTVLPTMTWVFFCQTLFILIGSMAAGLVVKHFSPHPVLLAGMLGIGLTMATIPVCETISSLAFVLAIMGFSMGLIDTTANVSMLRLYSVDVSPFLQALHFFYGLGAFLSPIIADPFLQNYDCSKLIDTSSSNDGFFAIEDDTPNKQVLADQPKTLEEARGKLQVDKAFWIMLAIQCPVIAALIWLMVKEKRDATIRRQTQERSESYEDLDKQQTATMQESKSIWFRCWTQNSANFILIIVFACILLFFADGMQGAYGGFVFSYAKLDIKGILSSEAAMINALFWGTFAAGRLMAVFTALYLQAGFILFLDILGALLAMILLIISPHSVTMLYVGTALFGLFLSSVYPSTISMVEQFIEIGPSATSCLVVAAASGEMIYPVIIGNLLDAYGPISFLVSGNLSLCCMAIVFVFLAIAGLFEKKHAPTQSFVKLICPWFFCKSGTTTEPNEFTVIRQSYKRFEDEHSPTEPYQGGSMPAH